MSKSQLIRTVITFVSALSLFSTALLADPPANKGKSGKGKNEAQSDRGDIHVDLGLSDVLEGVFD